MSFDSSLSEELSNKMVSQNECSSQTIFNYIHDTLKSSASSVDSNEFLSFVLQIYHSLSNSTGDQSPERCGICGESVPAKSRSSGSCARGHLFRIRLLFKLDDDVRTMFNHAADFVYAMYMYVSNMWTQEN